MRGLETRGEVEARDPRTADLKFMYQVPQSEEKPLPRHEVKLDSNGDDEYVVRFKAVIAGHAFPTSDVEDIHDELATQRLDATVLNNDSGGKSIPSQRPVEQLIHPRLVNAPTEGSHVKGGQPRHKPFGEVIRNVQCLRCQGWGHRAVDAECPVREQRVEMQEASRLRREDPLTTIHQSLGLEGSGIALKGGKDNHCLLPYDGAMLDIILSCYVMVW